MLIFTSISKLNFNLAFNQDSVAVTEELTEAFIAKYGLPTFERADKIIVVEDKFYHVLKDKFGPQIVGEFVEENTLDDIINEYLTLNQ